MGAKRKVDEKLYEKIKKELKAPKDDAKAIKKYNLGKTAIRAIRNSWCYDDYIYRTSHKRGTPATTSHMTDEDTKVSFTAYYVLMGAVCVGALIMLFILARWVFSLFGV